MSFSGLFETEEPGLLGLKAPKSKNLTVRSGPRIYDPVP